MTSITDNKSGGPIAVNTLVTYTVTFNEDMDAGTVTPASFGNAGSATISLGSVTETSPGVFTVEVTPTAAGTLQLQIHAAAVLKDVAGNNLDTASPILDDTTLTVDGTPPTLTSITDNKSGGPIAVNTLVTYTVTFNEDMDAGTVTPASFGNAGSATISLGSVTEISPGVFTVEATPTTNGTLQLQIHAAAVLKDVAGNNLDTSSPILDDTTLVVQSPYDSWSGSAAFDADANNDGVDNGTAWVLGAGRSILRHHRTPAHPRQHGPRIHHLHLPPQRHSEHRRQYRDPGAIQQHPRHLDKRPPRRRQHHHSADRQFLWLKPRR